MPETRGNITIDKGQIIVDGQTVGYVGQALKFGYHPAVRLTFERHPTYECWFENDQAGLVTAIFDVVKHRLPLLDKLGVHLLERTEGEVSG